MPRWERVIARQLACKAELYGRALVTVGRIYPSRKTCPACPRRLEFLPLAVGEWRFPQGAAAHYRDLNVARNTEREGLRQLQHPKDIAEARAIAGEGLAWQGPCQRESLKRLAWVRNRGDGDLGEFRLVVSYGRYMLVEQARPIYPYSEA